MSVCASIARRVVAGLGLLGTFVLLASVFAPDRLRAGEQPGIIDPIALGPNFAGESSNPHQGLRSLGTFESIHYSIAVFCTDVGPRYTVYSAGDHRELGVLMTADDVGKYFPDAPLPGVRFEMPTDQAIPGDGDSPQLMMAEPESSPDQW